MTIYVYCPAGRDAQLLRVQSSHLRDATHSFCVPGAKKQPTVLESAKLSRGRQDTKTTVGYLGMLPRVLWRDLLYVVLRPWHILSTSAAR